MLVLAALLTALSAANPPPSSCLTAFGQTACGYDCKAAFGKVRCSNVPHGACHAAFGDVVCGPAHSGGGFAVAGWPKAECVSAFGQTACGYDCKAAFGQVQCASVPFGVCQAAFGKVVCGPTPVAGGFPVASWPKAECVSAFGQVACGYGCTSGFGEIGCAATPWGACVAAFGGVTCASGDASLVWASARGDTIPPATCVSAFGKRACGWNCVAKRGEAGCGATPWSACDVQPDGRLVCSDPPMLVSPNGGHGAPW